MNQRLDSPTVRLPHQPQQIPPQLRLRLAHLVVRLEPPHRFRVLAPRLHQGAGDRETGASPPPPGPPPPPPPPQPRRPGAHRRPAFTPLTTARPRSAPP